MKKIKIFIASSIEEFYLDRVEIGNFFRVFNDCYLERGLYFSLIMCEDLSNSISLARKQEEYNREITDSDLVFFLFFTKTGQYTLEEFDVALKSYQVNEKPKIITYFKVADDVPPSDAVRSFMDRLDQELGHYYNIYGHIDTLKLGMMMQIKLLGLDGADIKLENGKASQDGVELMSLNNVEMVTNYGNLQHLKTEQHETEDSFLSCKIKYLENPDDNAAYDEFIEISKKRGEIKEKIAETEKRLYGMMEEMYEQTSKGKISRKQAAGYRLMERGKYEEAKAVLDFDEIVSESRRDEQLADKLEENAQIHVNEQLQLKEVNAALGDWDAVDACFTEAARIEERFNLPKKAMLVYARFLNNQNRFDEGIKLAEQLRYYHLNPKDDSPGADKSLLLTILGNMYGAVSRFAEAEETLKRAIELRLNEKSDIDLARAYILLGKLYYDSRRFSESAETYGTARGLLSKLSNDNPGAHRAELAGLDMNLGNIYLATNRFTEAEEHYNSALEKFIKLSLKDPDEFEPPLAKAYMNLGVVFKRLNKKTESEEVFKTSLEIHERLAGFNPCAYEPALVKNYTNLGNLYENMNRPDEAESAYNSAHAIQKRLAAYNPSAFEPDLAAICNNLGLLYWSEGRKDESETMFGQMLEIQKKLQKIDPEVYEQTTAMCYNNLGVLYNETGRLVESEEMYLSALEIMIRQAGRNPGATEPDLADVYNDLGAVYIKMDRVNEARNAFGFALSLYEKYGEKLPHCHDMANKTREQLENLFNGNAQ